MSDHGTPDSGMSSFSSGTEENVQDTMKRNLVQEIQSSGYPNALIISQSDGLDKSVKLGDVSELLGFMMNLVDEVRRLRSREVSDRLEFAHMQEERLLLQAQIDNLTRELGSETKRHVPPIDTKAVSYTPTPLELPSTKNEAKTPAPASPIIKKVLQTQPSSTSPPRRFSPSCYTLPRFVEPKAPTISQYQVFAVVPPPPARAFRRSRK